MKLTKKHLEESALLKKLIRTLAKRDNESCYFAMVTAMLSYRELLQQSEDENQMWRDFYKENKKALEPIIIDWNRKRDTV